jgi:molecular chaperone HtpG
MNAPWDHQSIIEEYRDFVAKRYPNEAILDIIPVEINEDGGKFKVGGVLFVPKQPGLIVREHGDVIVYIRHMFVCKEERTVLPEWAKFVKGIIESPNLRETASRETLLHDENLQHVRNVPGRLILDHLTRIEREDKRTFKEIVTNHNVVMKAWAVVSDELFERVRDIVLFQADNGPINLPDYFKTSRLSKKVPSWEGDTRYIFYFITPENTHAHLFAAKGLRVINACYVFDDLFLEKYAQKSDNVVLKRLDVGGDFIFEKVEWIGNLVVDALVQHYKTVEDFVSEGPDIVLAKVQVQGLGQGTIADIQQHLRKICKLQE